MVATMGTIVTNGVSPHEHNIPDSGGKLRGPLGSNGERVYRRRIRSLKDLPVQVVSHPNYAEGREIRSFSNLMISNGPKGGGHDPFVVNGGKSKPGPKAKRLQSDGRNPPRPSSSNLSLFEVTPQVGQVRGQPSMPNGGVTTGSEQSGPEWRVSQVMSLIPASKMQQSRAPSSNSLGGNSDRSGKLMSNPLKPAVAQRQSTLDQFFRDPRRKGKDVGGPDQQPGSSHGEMQTSGRGLLRRDRKSPPKIKRRKTMTEYSAPPLKGSIFPLIPTDDEFLVQKRRKIRAKGIREGKEATNAKTAIKATSKKRALLNEGDRDNIEGHVFPPAVTKKRRKQPAESLMQPPENSLNAFPSLGVVPVEAVNSSHPNVPPVTVPLEALGIPHAKFPPVSVSVEALEGRDRSLVPVSIPVESLGLPQPGEIQVVIPVESLGIPGLDQVHVSVAVDVPGNPQSILAPGKKETTNLTPKKKLSGTKKDGTPDGRFKNRDALALVTRSEDLQTDLAAPSADERAPNGAAGEVHAKKLPEVQKNGVRKPKRVQLKRLFTEKPEIHPPNGNGVASSRVVKSLWSPPKQFRAKHTINEPSHEPVGLYRPAKTTKFLSLQQLDASGKLSKMRGRPTAPVMKELDDSASDRTLSDCSTGVETLNWQASVGTSNWAQNVHDNHQNKPLQWKATSAKREQDVTHAVAVDYITAAPKKGKVGRPKLGEALASTSRGKTKKQPRENSLRDTESNGNLHGGLRVLEPSPVRELPPSGQQKIEKMTNGKLEEGNDGEGTPSRTRKQLITAHQELPSGLEGPPDDLELTPRSSMQSPTAEQIRGGDLDGANGVPRMTPRTRKLTDAMQNFLHQKASLLRQWKEMELGKLHPMALIGRSCKIFWPLDSEWYPGVIHEYNPQTLRHRIDYEDDEREWVPLAKERVKLHVSAEESKALEMSFGERSLTDKRKKLDADELAVLAACIEGCDGELSHGDLVWAKVKGYPMWPASVMDEQHAVAYGLEPSRERTVAVQFFGSYDHSRINPKKVVPFAKGIVHKYHTKCKRTVFELGLQEIERYLKECKLPDQMSLLTEDVEVVVVKKAADVSSAEETDDDDPESLKDETNGAVKKTWDVSCSFPLDLGTLRVLSLGKIVKDSEQFHNESHIWTEGYTALRKFASMKDPERIIEYKMEVLRNPATPAFPLFRVTPEDDRPVEAPTASGCWKKILIKIQRAKEKAGLCIATLLEKKRQSFRSGPSMFGFGDRRVSRLIQALPNAIVCSKFTAWIERPLLEDGDEELVPAGYRPVEFCWKHLDRCNVCYLDEEYADNLLLQCDKCRTMVHMYCYGELEPPDGDLWLCNLCRPEAPKRRPFCCLCPVTGGAMKPTTDGRWAHLTCAMWTPETCLVDVKRMEPVDGISSINKERWKLICTVCKVPYGACIQCSKSRCGVAFHPLCARAAGLGMEVLEDKSSGVPDSDGGLQLLTYCKKHSLPIGQGGAVRQQSQQIVTASQNCPAVSRLLPPPPPYNPSGCARSEPYNAASRRGHRQPEALAAALAKRFFVENKPYFVTGCQRNVPDPDLKSAGGSLWSWHWKQPKSGTNGEGTSNDDEADCQKTPQSTSERYRHMRSTLHERLTFGKSSIHGWGVFTKRSHSAGDMIIEYAGEVVRPIIADIRERRSYDSLVGAGTYMFRIDDERVVDATHAGSIAHLVNHSCEPNCYSRVVTASGDDHIIIFAKRDIREGEELTYDYRFASKDELLTCYCACAGCRGFVNSFDAVEEPTRIIASRSDLTEWVVT